jgi:hypothetical protein
MRTRRAHAEPRGRSDRGQIPRCEGSDGAPLRADERPRSVVPRARAGVVSGSMVNFQHPKGKLLRMVCAGASSGVNYRQVPDT